MRESEGRQALDQKGDRGMRTLPGTQVRLHATLIRATNSQSRVHASELVMERDDGHPQGGGPVTPIRPDGIENGTPGALTIERRRERENEASS